MLEVSHSLSVVFFTRMLYSHHSTHQPHHSSNQQQHPASSSSSSGLPPGVSVSSDGRSLYRDYFKLVVENEPRTEGPPERLLATLKQEFLRFPSLLDWWLPMPDGGGVLWGVPAKASRGNFLEAINVTLNVLEKHYMDRDLSRTGNSIVMISPSTGVMEVDAGLSAITKQRMMDNGIGMDMLSLSQPPMHTVPLFICNHHSMTNTTTSSKPTHDITTPLQPQQQQVGLPASDG